MMKARAIWSPVPYLNVTAVEREDSRWLVMMSGLKHACCPLCGVPSRSRHSSYMRTLGVSGGENSRINGVRFVAP